MGGGKSPSTYAALFLLLSSLSGFLFLTNKESKYNLYASPLAFLFCGWSMLPLISGAPLAPLLTSFSKFLFYVTVFQLLVTENQPQLRKTLMPALVALAGLESVLILFGSQGLLVGNPFYSSLLIAAALVEIALMFQNTTTFKMRSVCFCLMGMFLAALWILRSRSTLLGLVLAMPFYLNKQTTRWTIRSIVLLGLIFVAFKPEEVISSFKLNIFDLDWGRWTILKTALAALPEHVFVGWGMGNFETAYFIYQLPVDSILRFEKSTPFVHNDWVQLVAVTGIVGGAIFIMGLVQVLVKSECLTLKTDRNKWGWAVLIVYGVTSLFNFPFYLPFNGMIFCLALASIHLQNQKLKTSKIFSIGWMILLIGFSGYLSMDALSHFYQSRGEMKKASYLNPFRSEIWMGRYNRATDVKESLLCLDRALKWGSQNPFYWITMARFLNTFFPEKKLDIAQAYHQAINLAPQHAPIWVQRGIYEAQNDNLPMAKICFKKAIFLEPRSSFPYSLLGDVLKKEGQMKKGEALAQLAQKHREIFHPGVSKSSYSDFMFSLVNL